MSTPRRLPKPFQPDELRMILAASRPDVRALGVLLSETGLRLAEVCSITADEARGWQQGRGPFGLFRASPAFTSIIGKGDKERVVVVSPEAIRAAGVLLENPAERIRFDMLVPWGPRRIQELFAEVGERVGIRVHPHRFRHTAITAWTESGTPVDVVADLAGHSSVDTTRIYFESSRTRRIAALKRRRRWARRTR